MSVSTKLVLRTNKILSNGEHPIMLRITINRQSQFVTTKKSSCPEYWDDTGQYVSKSHCDHRTINPLLKSILSKTDLFLLNAGEENSLVSFDDLKNIVLKMTVTDRDIKSQNLLDYFEVIINRLKNRTDLAMQKHLHQPKDVLNFLPANRKAGDKQGFY